MNRERSFRGGFAALTDSRLQRAAAWATILILAFSPVTVAEVWAAEWFVDADTGSDAAAGTVGAPWKTITRAITEPTLMAGDVIHVDDGLYDAANGETFPLSLVDGVEIVADDGPAVTEIVGNDGTPVFENFDTDLGPGTALRDFTLRHETAAVGTPLMAFTLTSAAMEPEITGNLFSGTAIDPPTEGIAIEESGGGGTRSFTGLIENNSFTDTTTGVGVIASWSGSADYSPVIRANTMTGVDYGIYFTMASSIGGSFSPTIEGNTIDAAVVGVAMSFLFLSSSAGDVTVAPTVRGNTLTGFEGVWLSGSAAQTSATLTVDALLENNLITTDEHGFDLSLFGSSATSGTVVDWDVTVRNNTVTVLGDAHGILQLLSSVSGGVWAVDTVIAGNTVSSPFDDGIELSFFGLAGAQVGVSTDIVGNTTFGGDAGIAIDLSSLAVGVGLDLRVLGNEVSGDSLGLEANLWSQEEGEISLLVAGNTFTGALFGALVSATSSSSIGAATIEMRDNLARDNLDIGMGFGLSPPYDGVPLVTCNTVTANGDGTFTGLPGARLRARSTPGEKAAVPPGPQDAGIAVGPFGGTPDLGGGSAGSPGRNSIFGNTTTMPPPWDALNASSLSVAASANWWGSTDGPTIDSQILDDEENAFSGPVDFSSFLLAAPTVSPTAALGVSSGLTVTSGGNAPTAEFTATFEGGGDCGCVNPRVEADVPAGATVVDVSITQGVITDPDGLDGTVDAALGTLAPGDAVTFTYELLGGCLVTSQARLTCDNVGAPVATAELEQALPGGAADLSISKTDGQLSVAAGSALIYTVEVENLDPACPAFDVQITDLLPAAFQGATWTCTAGPGSACEGPDGTGNLDETIDLAAGETVVFSLSGTVDPSFEGLLTNTASLNHPDDPQPLNDAASDETLVTPLGGGAGVSPTEIPTLGTWSMLLLALLLGAVGLPRLRRGPPRRVTSGVVRGR